MAIGIFRAHKLGKQNRHQPGVTNDPSNATSSTSSTSHINDKFNGNIYVASKASLSAETHSSTNTDVKDATDDLIHTQSVSSPHTTNMLDKNVTVDD